MTELNDDDVLSLASKVPLLGEPTTFKVVQMKQAFKQQFVTWANATHAGRWLDDGFDGESLRVAGKGWIKGKIRLRIEFVPNEPEPSPDESFLDSLRTDIKPDQE